MKLLILHVLERHYQHMQSTC